MSKPRTVAFVHGIGPARSEDYWLTPLNDALASQGVSRLDPNVDHLITVDWEGAFKAAGSRDLPKRTWTAPTGRAAHDARMAFVAGQERIAAATARFAASSWFYTHPLAPAARERLARTIGDTLLPAVKRYRENEAARASAQLAVLRRLQEAGTVTVLAHSLGSVIVHDVLCRLDMGVHIDVLVTIGSPLSIPGIGDPSSVAEFPHDRVGAWLNLYNSDDWVSLGGGVAHRHLDALDLGILTKRDLLGGGHDARGFLAHPALATALSVVWSEPDVAAAADNVALVRPVHRAWGGELLSYAYMKAIADAVPTDQWKRKGRLHRVRESLARDRIASYVAHLASDEAGPANEILTSAPTEADLLLTPGVSCAGWWSDRDIAPLLVALAAGPPFPQFDVEVTTEERRAAMITVVSHIRRRDIPEVTNADYAKAVSAAVDVGRAAVKADSSGSGWLLLVGAAVLAATGVGLWAAVPAGLAGAAAITSALAAFGPGGMVGGMITLGLLTGTGGALLGSGLYQPSPAEQRLAQAAALDAITQQPVEGVRHTIASMLAVLHLQRAIWLDVSTAEVLSQLGYARDVIRRQLVKHRELAPGGKSVKEWEAKGKIVDSAIAWIAKETWPAPSTAPRRSD